MDLDEIAQRHVEHRAVGGIPTRPLRPSHPLRAWRKERGMTLRQLAELAEN